MCLSGRGRKWTCRVAQHATREGMLCKPRPQSIEARGWLCQRGKSGTRYLSTIPRPGCRCQRGTPRRSGSGQQRQPRGRSRREGTPSTRPSATWTNRLLVRRACMRSPQTSGCMSPGGKASTSMDQRGPGSSRTLPESRGCRRCPWPRGACPRGSACTGLRRGSARCPLCKRRTRRSRHRPGCARRTRSRHRKRHHGATTELGRGRIRCQSGCVPCQSESI